MRDYLRASRNARSGHRGNYSDTDLPVNRALIVFLMYHEGGQYADESHGDRQKDQQQVI
jgi:hypothetical protein